MYHALSPWPGWGTPAHYGDRNRSPREFERITWTGAHQPAAHRLYEFTGLELDRQAKTSIGSSGARPSIDSSLGAVADVYAHDDVHAEGALKATLQAASKPLGYKTSH